MKYRRQVFEDGADVPEGSIFVEQILTHGLRDPVTMIQPKLYSFAFLVPQKEEEKIPVDVRKKSR